MLNPTLFWSKFTAFSTMLANRLRSNQSQFVFSQIEAFLREAGYSICFEISGDSPRCLLAFSPEGDKHIAEEIAFLVRDKPQIDEWQIFQYRQKKPIKDVNAIMNHLYFTSLDDIRFTAPNYHDRLHFSIFVDSEVEMFEDEIEGCKNTLLWHLFGEEQVMNTALNVSIKLGSPPNNVLTIGFQDFLAQPLINELLNK